eukprot:scaffold399009_cov27-Prasinocladus_malaysianus.AAC.1
MSWLPGDACQPSRAEISGRFMSRVIDPARHERRGLRVELLLRGARRGRRQRRGAARRPRMIPRNAKRGANGRRRCRRRNR